MAKTNFRTWTTSELVTADMLNEQIRDNGNEIWKGTTAGDLDYYTSATTKDRIPIGTSYDILSITTGGEPAWRTIPYCYLSRTTAQSIPNNTTTTITGYDAVTEVDGEWYSSGGTITIPDTGWYLFIAKGIWAGHATASTLRQIAIYYEESSIFAAQSTVQDSGTSDIYQTTSFMYGLTPTATLTFRVLQKSGGNLNFTPFFYAMRLR